MGLWKIAGMTVLGFVVAVAGAIWAPGVSGSEPAVQAAEKAGQDEKKIEQKGVFTIREGGPQRWAVGELLGQLSGSRLGVQIRDIAEDDVTKLKLASHAGVVIEQVVEESAAAKAGLKTGDVVVQFDGEAVRSVSQFTRLVRETPVGRTVKMAVIRAGSKVEVTATTEEAQAPLARVGEWARPDTARLRADAERLGREIERSQRELQRDFADRRYEFRIQPHVAPGPGPGRLGVTIQNLTPELAEYFGVKDGVLVSSVEKESPAANAGIKAGDVITSIDGTAVSNGSSLVDQLRTKEGEVAIGLSRERKAITLKATLEKAQATRGRIIARRGPA